MEVISESQVASPYVTAPSSPCAINQDNKLYYTSPTRHNHEYASTLGTISNSDDEFQFEASTNLDCSIDNGLHQEQYERKGSLPTMAFADELFSNGQMMPLKLPPRLQSCNGSTTSSPRSPSSVFKSPFSRRIAWTNDIDPFMVAFQKVTEEKRGRRKSVSNDHSPRRARSHSPFKSTIRDEPIVMIGCPGKQNSLDPLLDHPLQWSTENVHLKPVQSPGPNSFKQVEPKGFIYARWVRDQTKHVGTSPKEARRPTYKRSGGVTMETKMQRIKGLLLKYASFGRKKKNDTKQNRLYAFWKPNFFSRRGLRLKGSGNGYVKESKMEIVRYKPSLCIGGYGIESPRN